MLLMEPLVAMSMLKGREAGSTGCEQSERPHFHGVKERLESEQKKKKESERMRGGVSVINRHRYKGTHGSRNRQGFKTTTQSANALISAV